MRIWQVGFTFLFIFLLTACQSTTEPQNDTLQNIESKTKEEMTLKQQLIDFAAKGDTERVLGTLKEDIDINATDEQGNTAVMAAAQNNYPDTVKALILEGADINIRNNNEDNVLLYAGAEGFLEIVEIAVAAGADTTLTNRYGGTALIPAAERGHVDVIETLLTNSDTDVNHINNLHWTALLEAVILSDGGEAHQKIVQLLVDNDADVTIGDKDGVTPLEHAEKSGFKEIEKILQEARD